MDIKRNLYQNGIFITCSTVAGGTLAALNTVNVSSGAAFGLVSGLAVVGGLALYDNRPDKTKPNRPKNHAVRAFEFQGSNHTQGHIKMLGVKELLGFGRKMPRPQSLPRPVELDEWLFGSYTRSGRPFIFSERDLFKFFRSVGQHPDPPSNLSRRYHVDRVRSVRADMFDAIRWFIGLTQFTTGVQLVREEKHQHYGLNRPGQRVFILMCWVEHCERQRGRGALRMNEALTFRSAIH